ncbi:MAG: autotransporter domain-containing protein [Deltaproteobacteria bacterium]|nr:autotransporter domain-containing protein [Deltaproteobacteria bacterium]
MKNNTEVLYAYGGYAMMGYYEAGIVYDNTVRFEGATVTGNVFGGYYYLDDTLAQGNHVEFASGINSVAALHVYGDLNITGGTQNKIGTVDKIQDGVAISGGSDNIFEHGLDAFSGGIKITGGTTTVRDMIGSTNDPASKVSVAGTGSLRLDGNGGSAFAITGDMEISSGGEVSLVDLSASPASLIFKQDSGKLTVGSGGILDLGIHTLTLANSGTVTFENNSTIVSAGDGTDLGTLKIPSGYDWGFAAENSSVNVLYTGPKLTSGQSIITADVMPINATGSRFYSPIYSLEFGPTGVRVDEYIGYGGGLSQLATGPNPNLSRVGSLLDAISDDAMTDPASQEIIDSLGTVVSSIFGLGLSPADADVALRQLIGESVLNVQLAATNIAMKTQGVVFGRLDKLRSGSGITPPSVGSAGEQNRLWVGGFGTWARQRNADGVYGYDYEAGGFSLGYDRTFSGMEGLVLGFAVSFSFGKLDTNDGLSDVDIDTAGFGLYGSYSFRNGAFLDASFAYAKSSNKYTANLVTGGQKKGSFDIDTWHFALRGGMNFEAGNFVITPSLGLRYLRFRQEGFTEQVINSTFPRNYFGKVSDYLVEIPLEIKIKTTLGSGDVQVTPELRLGYTYAPKRPDNVQSVGFVGNPRMVPIYGVKPPRSTMQVGLGVNIKTGGAVDIFVNYDANFAKGFHEHKGSLGLEFQF